MYDWKYTSWITVRRPEVDGYRGSAAFLLKYRPPQERGGCIAATVP
jgi:hypothetical protein